MAETDDITRLFESFGQSAAMQGYRSFHRVGNLKPAWEEGRPAACSVESALPSLQQVSPAQPATDSQQLGEGAQAMNDATVDAEAQIVLAGGAEALDAAASCRVAKIHGDQPCEAKTSSRKVREATPLLKIFERLLSEHRQLAP